MHQMLTASQIKRFEVLCKTMNEMPYPRVCLCIRQAINTLVEVEFGAEIAEAFRNTRGISEVEDIDNAIQVIVNGPRPMPEATCTK